MLGGASLVRYQSMKAMSMAQGTSKHGQGQHIAKRMSKDLGCLLSARLLECFTENEHFVISEGISSD